jgi:putative nucleotidyltransferase-like protein
VGTEPASSSDGAATRSINVPGTPPARQDLYDPYRRALHGLNAVEAPFLVGGTWAFAQYTGIARPTKDLDLFVTRQGRDRVLEALRALGWETHVAFPHWLAKARQGGHCLDVIHGAGNGVAMVDDEWFQHARASRVLGVRTRLVPAEEMIWSKAFVMEKYRYDGADVAHLILRQGKALDWKRLLRRFGRHWRVLLAHLVLFEFIYPGRHVVPDSLLAAFARKAARENAEGPGRVVCRGVLLSRKQYRVDTESWGLRDARLDSDVAMSPEDILDWTLADPGKPGPDA